MGKSNFLKLILVAIDTIIRTKNMPIETIFISEIDDKSRLTTIGNKPINCEVLPLTTYRAMVDAKKEGDKVGILCFANAKYAGGGFLTGSTAQEESLCYMSNLYRTQLNEPDYYKLSRDKLSGVYSHNQIVSRNVKFIKDEDYNIVDKPFNCDIVITCSAVSKVRLDKNKNNIIDIQSYMTERIRLILQTFLNEGCNKIILGAFGCGVFKNDPEMIAQCFKEVIYDMQLGTYFDKIIFAIPKGNNGHNYDTFKKVMGDWGNT